MDWGQVQPIASGVLLVATIISTAVVGVLFGTNKTLRETVGDRGVRIDDLEKNEVRLKSDLTDKTSEANVLKSMVTGKVELIALGDQLDEHHRVAVEQWGTIDGHILALPTAIADVLRDTQEKKP